MDDMILTYIRAFITGGLLCVIAQILLDKTKLTSGRILVGYVVAGVFLTALGIYEPIVNFGKAGATVPLSGFGYALATGVFNAIDEEGFIGILTGGVKGTSAGITAAIVFGCLASLIFRPKMKRS